MRISVVIPAYNEEKYIVTCLKAFGSQTKKAYEIIVVDNNSRDKTGEIAAANGAKVIVEKTQGITPARNAGFNAASGDIIARCDADTIVSDDWLQKIGDFFETADPYVLAITGTSEFYDAPPKFKKLWERNFKTIYFGGSKLIAGTETLYGSNMALRRSAWEKVKDEVCLDDALVHEDIDLSIHLSQYGKIVYRKDLKVACALRGIKVDVGTMQERLAKWPRTRLAHTKIKKFVKPGKKHSSSAQNLKKKALEFVGF